MARLAVATRDQIERVYAESHALWGGGLSLRDYVGMWRDLLDTAWARKWFTYLVWLDDSGEILSSLKLYRPLMRCGGDTSRACAIGAVYTPRSRRREGHAASMIRAVLEAARDRGDATALLFSDIGTKYYAAMGFRELPSEETTGVLGRNLPPAPAGWTLRPMTADDLDAVRSCHDDWCRRRSFAILRDREHWEFLLERARAFFARSDGSDLSRRYRVALEDGRFAGYLVAVEGDGEWNLREAGVPGADPDRLACLLRTAASEARADGNRRVYGWLPREWGALVPEWRLRRRPRTRAVAMLRPLVGTPEPPPFDDADAAFLPYLDQF